MKGKLSRREEVVVNRLSWRILTSHTGTYMSSGTVDHLSICDKCGGTILTVKHILIKCSELSMLRNRICGSGI